MMNKNSTSASTSRSSLNKDAEKLQLVDGAVEGEKEPQSEDAAKFIRTGANRSERGKLWLLI
jgi:hypothetical protein